MLLARHSAKNWMEDPWIEVPGDAALATNHLPDQRAEDLFESDLQRFAMKSLETEEGNIRESCSHQDLSQAVLNKSKLVGVVVVSVELPISSLSVRNLDDDNSSRRQRFSNRIESGNGEIFPDVLKDIQKSNHTIFTGSRVQVSNGIGDDLTTQIELLAEPDGRRGYIDTVVDVSPVFHAGQHLSTTDTNIEYGPGFEETAVVELELFRLTGSLTFPLEGDLNIVIDDFGQGSSPLYLDAHSVTQESHGYPPNQYDNSDRRAEQDRYEHSQGQKDTHRQASRDGSKVDAEVVSSDIGSEPTPFCQPEVPRILSNFKHWADARNTRESTPNADAMNNRSKIDKRRAPVVVSHRRLSEHASPPVLGRDGTSVPINGSVDN